MQRRFKTYKSAYNDACRIKKRSGTGVTNEDIACGNNTIEKVLEWKRYGFERTEKLYEKHSNSEPTCAADFSTQGMRILSSGNGQDESHEAEEYEVDEFPEIDEPDESYECGDEDDLHQGELPVHTTQSTAQSFSKDAVSASQGKSPEDTKEYPTLTEQLGEPNQDKVAEEYEGVDEYEGIDEYERVEVETSDDVEEIEEV
ncbi:hypothetical protein BGX20_004973 [Mortierella sp. AD010]|nr:hypothetical protein BGX20_004973 [Mortierella sp. AD010]